MGTIFSWFSKVYQGPEFSQNVKHIIYKYLEYTEKKTYDIDATYFVGPNNKPLKVSELSSTAICASFMHDAYIFAEWNVEGIAVNIFVKQQDKVSKVNSVFANKVKIIGDNIYCLDGKLTVYQVCLVPLKLIKLYKTEDATVQIHNDGIYSIFMNELRRNNQIMITSPYLISNYAVLGEFIVICTTQKLIFYKNCKLAHDIETNSPMANAEKKYIFCNNKIVELY